MKSILDWYISDINIATRVYLNSISTDIGSSIYGAICFSQVLFDIKMTLKRYRLIRLFMIDKLIRKIDAIFDIDIPYLGFNEALVIRESTKVQIAAYSQTLNNNIICILNVVNVWIVLVICFIATVVAINWFKGALKTKTKNYDLTSCKNLELNWSKQNC